MSTAQSVIGAIITAVASISATILITHHDHDLTRTVSAVGVVLAGEAGIITAAYHALARRMARVESITGRVVAVDHEILRHVRNHSLN